MTQWNVKPSIVFILSCVFFLMLLIVVLPNVDLPDTAFHRGTAPVLVYARATSAPISVILAGVFRLPETPGASRPSRELETVDVTADPNFRPILFRSIRC